jgi:hypothetical protein
MAGWADIGSAATGLNQGLKLNQEYQQTQDLMDKREESDQRRMADMQPFDDKANPMLQALNEHDPKMANEFTKTIQMMPGGMTKGNAKRALEALASDAAGVELIGTIGLKAKEREIKNLMVQRQGLTGPQLAQHDALISKKGEELKTGAEGFADWQFKQAVDQQPPEIKRYMSNLPGSSKEKMDILKTIIEETIKGKMRTSATAGKKLVPVKDPDTGIISYEYVDAAVGKGAPTSPAENKSNEDFQKLVITLGDTSGKVSDATKKALVAEHNRANPYRQININPTETGWGPWKKTVPVYEMSEQGAVGGVNLKNPPVTPTAPGGKTPPVAGSRPKTRQEAINSLKEDNPGASLQEIDEFINATWKDLY